MKRKLTTPADPGSIIDTAQGRMTMRAHLVLEKRRINKARERRGCSNRVDIGMNANGSRVWLEG